jgi:hypothetical protein
MWGLWIARKKDVVLMSTVARETKRYQLCVYIYEGVVGPHLSSSAWRNL